LGAQQSALRLRDLGLQVGVGSHLQPNNRCCQC
jgi:hypothetical protein